MWDQNQNKKTIVKLVDVSCPKPKPEQIEESPRKETAGCQTADFKDFSSTSSQESGKKTTVHQRQTHFDPLLLRYRQSPVKVQHQPLDNDGIVSGSQAVPVKATLKAESHPDVEYGNTPSK